MAGSVAVAPRERSQVPRPAVVARRDVAAARWDRRHRADLAAPHLAEVPAAAHRVSVAAVPDVPADDPAAAHRVRAAAAPDVPADDPAAAHRVRVAAVPDVPADGLAAAHPVVASVLPAALLAVFVAGPAVAAPVSCPPVHSAAAPAPRRRSGQAAWRGQTPTPRQTAWSPSESAFRSDSVLGWWRRSRSSSFIAPHCKSRQHVPALNGAAYVGFHGPRGDRTLPPFLEG